MAWRIFKTKGLIRFVRSERISDANLIEAIERAERGLIDADLGGGLIKQRVARKGQGRLSGYRMIVAYRSSDRVVFLFGFAKRDRDNISPDQLAELRQLASSWLNAPPHQITEAVENGTLQEIYYDEEKA